MLVRSLSYTLQFAAVCLLVPYYVIDVSWQSWVKGHCQPFRCGCHSALWLSLGPVTVTWSSTLRPSWLCIGYFTISWHCINFLTREENKWAIGKAGGGWMWVVFPPIPWHAPGQLRKPRISQLGLPDFMPLPHEWATAVSTLWVRFTVYQYIKGNLLNCWQIAWVCQWENL
jgi:hypothetical protein